jgi:two-component system chemotaxis response regulator CheB
MGCDGAQGLLAMARAGAKTIAQDEATSTVSDAACGHLAGAARVVAPIERIADHLLAGGAA